MFQSNRSTKWTSIRVAALAGLMAMTACPANPGHGDKPVTIDVERFHVDVRDDDYAMGGDTPLVTVVMFSDYVCVPCGRTWKILNNLHEDYGDDLRIVYRSYTVAGHLNGDRAAEAAFAAGAQGKFWEMHWRLFADEDKFSRPSLRAHAEALGLDVPQFFDEIDTGLHSGRRMRDRRQATELGIRALPVTFINGLFLMGAPADEAAWHAIIDEEMKRSREMMQEGTPRAELYAGYLKTAKRGVVMETSDAENLRTQRMVEKAAREATKRVTLNRPDAEARYAVPTEGAPALGPEDAPVVIVEFIDFQCPYCQQAHAEVVTKIREAYPQQVRLVARHLPLEIHPVAPGAAKAAIAAGRQNEFWNYHDRLFDAEAGLGRQKFVEIARALGLDIDQFQADLDRPEVAKVVDDDIALSRTLGVTGTPGFFVNGRYLHGAQDFGTFRALIDEELALAKDAVASGTPREAVHAALMKDALGPEQFLQSQTGRRRRMRRARSTSPPLDFLHTDQKKRKRTMKHMKYSSLIVTSLALALGGSAVGCKGKKKSDETAEVASDGKLVTVDDVDDSMNELVEGERYQITYDEEDMALGPATAAVTIIEYSDFQCPYCTKLTNNLHDLQKEFPDDVRIVFKHFPLESIHKQAMLASQAALAANAQGKGWEVHDKMFENQRKLTKEDVIKYAEEAGVPDMEKYKKALEDETYKDAVKADQEQGAKYAVRSTPSFFVNGRPMRGAKPVDAMKKIVEEEKEAMQKLLDKGSKPEELYARVMKAAKTERKAPPQKKKQRPGQPEADKNYGVPTGDDRPFFGNEEALVTIIEFSDFQCPYCKRVNPTLDKIKEKYPEDIRLIFRQHPLPMHKQAPAAARAATAANFQGKFWEMHDALFEAGRELDAENAKIMELAEGMGMDMAKFKKDFDSDKVKAMVKEDEETSMKWGARGTPAFFVNGRFISGAQPPEAFEKLIEEEKKKAEKFMKDKGVEAKDLYVEMAKTWEQELKIPPPPPPADFKRRDVSTKGLPGTGNTKNPKITIVECSDFDCPYCKRGSATAKKVVEEYGDKVALYFAHNPLPMHKKAEPAHRASIAAGNQGKFWEMHDLLFENNKRREEADYVEFAEKLGLDIDKFKSDWAAAETASKVTEDSKVCAGYEVRGVPGFLINGRLMSGAQPWPRFKEVLDEELAGGFEATQKKAAAGKKGDGAKKAG